MKTGYRLLLSILFCALAIFSSDTAAQTPGSPASSIIYRAYSGHWKGTLEYRDYSSDKRVKLPTLLEISPASAGQALSFHYTYDDGPGKIVNETEAVQINLTAQEYVVQENDGTKTVYHIEKVEGFLDSPTGSLLLSGPGIENDQKVEVRTTVHIAADSLTILRETRLPGTEFKFRHQYTFARTEPVTSPGS